MIFCSNCGAQQPTGTRFCGSCGTPMAAPANPQATTPPAQTPYGSGRSTPYATSTPSQPAQPATPWATQGEMPWAPSGTNGASSVDLRGAMTKGRDGFSRIPRPVVIGVAALAAIGIGAGAAFMMREDPAATLDPALLSQQGTAPTKTPTKAWSVDGFQLAAAANLGTTDENVPSTFLDYGTNGMLLASVGGQAAVAVKESTGKPVWHVPGVFDSCLSNGSKSGWVCTYRKQIDSTSDSSTPEKQLVTLDNNGRLAVLHSVKDDEKLSKDKTGELWLTSGLSDSNSSESTSTSTVSVEKLDAAGKKVWRFENNLSSVATAQVRGSAAAPLFTLDGTTYVRGLKDGDGKGIALDSSGKQTGKASSPVLGNYRGRPIMLDEKTNRLKIGGDKMQRDISTVTSPMLADTGDLPLYATKGSDVEKLNSSGTDDDWKASLSASPLAYCGKTSVFTGDGTQGWFYDDSGKSTWGAQLPGSPKFCWGGEQLVSLDGTKVTSQKLSDGSTAWGVDVAGDGSTISSVEDVVYSPTSNGFVAVTNEGFTYYGV